MQIHLRFVSSVGAICVICRWLWQNASMTKLLMTAVLLTQTLPAGYWPLEKSQPLIDKTQTIRLTSDLSKLSEGERKAVAKLLEAGQIFQRLYEEQRHPQAISSFVDLKLLDKRLGSPTATQNLLTLYRL